MAEKTGPDSIEPINPGDSTEPGPLELLTAPLPEFSRPIQPEQDGPELDTSGPVSTGPAPGVPPTIPITPRKRKARKKRKARGARAQPAGQPEPETVGAVLARQVGSKGGPDYAISSDSLEEILGYIGTGGYTETAVLAAGCNVAAHYKRMQNNPGYATAIRKARAYAEIALGARVAIGAKGHRGAAWLLERTRAERFASRAYIALDRKRIGEMTDGELAELLPHAMRALADRARDSDGGEIIDITPKPVDSGLGANRDAQPNGRAPL